jgi:hypothetical protein
MQFVHAELALEGVGAVTQTLNLKVIVLDRNLIEAVLHDLTVSGQFEQRIHLFVDRELFVKDGDSHTLFGDDSEASAVKGIVLGEVALSLSEIEVLLFEEVCARDSQVGHEGKSPEDHFSLAVSLRRD